MYMSNGEINQVDTKRCFLLEYWMNKFQSKFSNFQHIFFIKYAIFGFSNEIKFSIYRREIIGGKTGCLNKIIGKLGTLTTQE